MSETASYKTVVKNTAIIGGSQAVQILASLLRNKMAAVLLGATGMGINALLFSAIMVVQQFSSIGIFQSGVRELASVKDDKEKLSSKVNTFRKLAILCGIFGIVSFIILSPLLSIISFGNTDFIWYFVAVSITPFLMAIQSTSSTIMQATGNIRLLALASIIGTVGNMIVVIICYYLWGINGIIPAVLIGYVVFLWANRYYENRIPLYKMSAKPIREVITQSKPVLRQGSALMVSQLLIVTFTYLLSSFISNVGSIAETGMFNAAAMICLHSMTVVYSTLSADYFPRLSAVCNDRDKMSRTLNNQTEIMLFIVLPISLIIIVSAPVMVKIILSREFLPIVSMLRVMALSFIFRALWSVSGFIAIAKGDNKTFLIYDALIGNGSGFLLNIVAFYLWGLNGLGFSYLISSIFMTILLTIVIRFKYGLSLSKSTTKQVIFMLLILAATFFSVILLQGPLSYIISGILICLTIIYCYRELDKRIGILDIIKRRLKFKMP